MEDLGWLAESGQIDKLRAALADGADPNARDEEGRSPLHLAAERGHLEAIDALVDAGADLEAAETAAPGWRPLHRACLPSPVRAQGDPPTIARLLARGADALAANTRGVTALHLVVPWGEAELVEALLEAGAVAGAADANGVTPLHAACRRGSLPLTEGLLADDGELTGPALGRRADSAVARLEDRPVVLALLEAGAELGARDAEGRTPLHVAVESGAEWAVHLLLERGASVHEADSFGVTPLHLAATPALAERMLEAGAEIDPMDREGRTPLHRAIAAGRDDVAEHLLGRGASPRAIDGDGRTPLHLAAGAGRGLLVERLLEEPIDVAAEDDAGRTALDDARAGGHRHVVEILKRRGRGRGKRFPFFGA
jgi:cytohesin